MKKCDKVYHSDFGQGSIVAVSQDLDQVRCDFKGREYIFTIKGAAALAQAALTSVPEAEPELEEYQCPFCEAKYGSRIAFGAHRAQCKKNPDAKSWVRKRKSKESQNTKKEEEKPVVKKNGKRIGDKDVLHTTEIAPKTKKIVRNVLTSRWLALVRNPENGVLTIDGAKVKFVDGLFDELGI